MKWEKKGLVFDLEKHKIPWVKSHAMMPLVLDLESKFRIYFTGRHLDGKSRISFFDLSKDDLSSILYVHDKPLMDVGKIGTFDDCGTVGTKVLKFQGKVYLFYNGYNVRNTVPWSNSIGVAISEDDGMTFSKYSEGPIMDRNTVDPYFTITPEIKIENNMWHMWYTSGLGWLNVDKRIEPLYNIKYASSNDGLNWTRENITVIHQKNDEECVARPTIQNFGDKYLMAFTYRGSRDFRNGNDSYQIGYAISNSLVENNWERIDDMFILPRMKNDFDDKMQAYPCLIRNTNTLMLFYNGNGFGSQGIGCSIIDLKRMKK